MKNLMGKCLALLIVFITAVSIYSFTIEKASLVGEWRGTDNTQKSAVFIFSQDEYLTMIMDGKTMGGKDFEVNGKKVDIKYEVNSIKTPMWLDFVFYLEGKKLEGKTSNGIFRFIDANRIELRMNNTTNTHYDKFDASDKENTIFLTRVNK